MILTDENDIPDVIGRLRSIYPNIMKLDYDNCRTRAEHSIEMEEDQEKKSPLELLDQFYALQNGQSMGEEQRAFAQQLMESIWEGER